jgi:hypothetical protein
VLGVCNSAHMHHSRSESRQEHVLHAHTGWIHTGKMEINHAKVSTSSLRLSNRGTEPITQLVRFPPFPCSLVYVTRDMCHARALQCHSVYMSREILVSLQSTCHALA